MERNSYASAMAKNEEKFMEFLAELDPELWRTKRAIDETKFNSAVLPRIIRAINNIAIGEGYGSVNIEISSSKIKVIRSSEVDKIDLPVNEED